jgi:hypothetical protein
MRNGFEIEATPLHTAAAAAQHVFNANRFSGDGFSGYFHDVFPDRGNGDEERWGFWIQRSGQVKLRLVTGGGGVVWQQLSDLTCYRGPGSQLVVRGSIDVPGQGTDFWTFVMNYGGID